LGAFDHGATSNVYQAVSSNGKKVALKVYVNNFDAKEGRLMEKENFEEVARKATEKEAKLLRAFYPFLKEEVKAVQLFGLYCVVMPFLEPVLKEKRKDQLPKSRMY
jgi:RIO-like serine/threonine protein kinase